MSAKLSVAEAKVASELDLPNYAFCVGLTISQVVDVVAQCQALGYDPFTSERLGFPFYTEPLFWSYIKKDGKDKTLAMVFATTVKAPAWVGRELTLDQIGDVLVTVQMMHPINYEEVIMGAEIWTSFIDHEKNVEQFQTWYVGKALNIPLDVLKEMYGYIQPEEHRG